MPRRRAPDAPALSDVALRAWGADPARREIPDAQVPGLIARGEPSGTPTFHLRKRVAGRRVRITLGAYPNMSLKTARVTAIDALAALNAGRDPSAELRARQAEALIQRVEPETVAQRWREWMEARDRDWTGAYGGCVRRVGKTIVLPALGGRVLREVTRSDWSAVVIGKRRSAPAMATVLYRTISAFLGYAESAGWIELHPLPRKGLAKLAPPPRPRSRVLADGELRAIWRASERQLSTHALASIRWRALLRLLLLTGARLSEVSGMKPGEVAFEARTWTVPASRAKNKRAYTIGLGELAMAEIAATGADLHASRCRLKDKIDELSGVTGWRLHDLRRTVRTGLSKLGVRREVAERCINHRPTGLVGIYEHHDYADEVIEALLKWQQHVAIVVGANVVPPRA